MQCVKCGSRAGSVLTYYCIVFLLLGVGGKGYCCDFLKLQVSRECAEIFFENFG